MDTLQVKALSAGLFFGLWPLFMNRSGLSGNVSSAVFSCIVFAFTIPFAVHEFSTTGNLASARWAMAITAGILSGIGILFFNGMLAKAAPQSVGTLFVLMILTQTAVPAAYQTIIDGGVSLTKGSGFVFAAIAAALLCKG